MIPDAEGSVAFSARVGRVNRLLSLAVVCVLLGSCSGQASNGGSKPAPTAELAGAAIPTRQPVIVVNKDTKRVLGRLDILPHCVTYSVAGVAQEKCIDTWTPGPDLAPQLQQQSVAVRACWNPIRIGEPLPDCWR